jgi:ABC-2 type transport system ATP-binding protein
MPPDLRLRANWCGVVIELQGVTKRYGDMVAVNDLSFTVKSGVVTGFLGPNGAGKTTTMRLILGLASPTAGTATIDGRPFRQVADPLREVGALLDAGALQGKRTVRNHLLWLAQSGGLPKARVTEMLELVGLSSVAGRPCQGLSLGMRQRLGIAAALLGDPKTLLFDEPVNGLDPEGVRWIRTLMKSLAADGRTVFVSSHLMSEMQNTADALVVIGRGKLIANCATDEFIDAHSEHRVQVRTPQADELTAAVTRAGGRVTEEADGMLTVRGIDAQRIGDLAYEVGAKLYALIPSRGTLEDAFMEMTAGDVEFQAGGPAQQASNEQLNTSAGKGA